MKTLSRILAAALVAIASLQPPASAQTVTPGLTPGCSSPPPAFGVVWTASQWIVCLTSLQPFLGYIPLNAGGGAMSGELTLSPSVTTNAPLNFQLGVAPTSPVNGDFWFTTAGPFYRAGGVTIGPLASTSSPTLASPTFTGTVTFPDGTTWTSTLITPSTALSAFWASPPAIGGTAAASAHFTTLFASGATSLSTATGTSLALGGATIGSNALAVTGTANVSGTASLGTGSTDYVTAAGGASGGTLSTNAGTLTLSSGGGATTNLSDTTVKLGNAVYASCGVLGTSSNNIICSSPSSFITYNDDVTTNTVAVSGNLYCMDTAGGALTLTLPASPSNGNYVAFTDCGGNFNTFNLTIGRNGSSIMYNAGDMVVSTRYAAAVLRYSIGKTSWILSPL